MGTRSLTVSGNETSQIRLLAKSLSLIDDNPANVSAATILGLSGILFENRVKLIDALAALR